MFGKFFLSSMVFGLLAIGFKMEMSNIKSKDYLQKSDRLFKEFQSTEYDTKERELAKKNLDGFWKENNCTHRI